MNEIYGLNNGIRLERVRYFSRQLITADDMLAEQQYFRQKLRRHNRFLHGWGVVCGMGVSAAPDEKKKIPWRVKIDAGYALGPYGDEIYIAEPFCYDLAKCLEQVPDPCEPGEPAKPVLPSSSKLYLAIRYLECESRPVRIHPLGCACEDTLCEYSRIRDDFEIGCLPEMPKVELPLICEILGKQLAACPPCPESPWAVLAEVTLPDKAETVITGGAINNFVRRQLFSTAMLQEQLIECCCEPPPPPPPPPPPAQVTKVNPPNGKLFINVGPSQIEVTFNKNLQVATVNSNTIVLTRSGTSVPGNVSYNNSSKMATFKPMTGLAVGDYQITVRGNGAQHIIDVDNLALDGEGNGTAGGDFISKFTVQKLA